MSVVLRISLIIALLAYFTIVMLFLRSRKLDLKYSLLWIFFGVVMLLMIAFPQLINSITSKLGVVDEVNGVFAIVIFSLLIILMSITAIVSKMNDDIKTLTQKCSFYEERIRQLENDDKRV